MKVAILFWGLTRSTDYTIESIEKNVYNQLSEKDISFDVFVHTYSISGEYHNNHSKEHTTKYSHETYKLLKPHYYHIDNQEKTAEILDLLQYRTHPDVWESNYQSVDNFILAMNSKKKVTQMMENTGNMYDKVLYLRPDVRFIVPFNPLWIVDPAYNHSLLIPGFHSSGGINDRMACCSMHIAHIYGYLFDHLLEFSKQKSLHSESIHSYIMSLHRVPIVIIPFYFNRVRYNGIERRDCPKYLERNS